MADPTLAGGSFALGYAEATPGLRIRILDEPVRTSARRQLREGLVRCTLRNLCLRLLFHCGVRPASLARLYRRHGE
jgi:hypothetical protein